MYQLINVQLAVRLGVPQAVAVQCLMDAMDGMLDIEVEVAKGEVWVRMGHKTLALYAPYIAPATAKRALKRLVDRGICKRTNLNESPFDHTYWYAFTDFGHRLMQVTAESED